MLMKDYRKAIPLLQQATVDQRRAPAVQVLLAKCFLAEKQPRLARSNLERACEKLNPHDEPETYCKAHYVSRTSARRAATATTPSTTIASS